MPPKAPAKASPKKKVAASTTTTTTATTTPSSAKPKATASPAKPAAKATASPAKPATKATTSAKPAAKAGGGPAKGGTKKATKAVPAAASTDPKDVAATTIQRCMRGRLGRVLAAKTKTQKKEAAEEMAVLARNAWIAQVQYDRKKEENRLQKVAEERKRRQEQQKKEKAFLEAAYDGELADLKKLRKEGVAIDCCDPHGHTALSEAAAAGNLEVITYLLSEQSNPNTRGQFGRTPLWRASFSKHESCVAALLKAGGDPRLKDTETQAPFDVAASPEISKLLEEWDVAETDRLLEEFAAVAARRLAKEKEEAAAARQQLASQSSDEEAVLEGLQKVLKAAYCELDKRINEYDTCVAEGRDAKLLEAVLASVKEAEATLADAKRREREQRDVVDFKRLALREFDQQEEADVGGLAVYVKELNDVVFKDVGGRLSVDGRWPLVVDKSGQSNVFFKYAQANYISALNFAAVQPEALRKTLLGSIRWGKPLVVDTMEVGFTFSQLGALFDEVQVGLWESLLSKKLLENDMFMSLVKPTDGDDFLPQNFSPVRIRQFQFIVVSSASSIDETLAQRLYLIRVKLAES